MNNSQNIRREVRNDVCTLTFDKPNSAANILDAGTFDELNAHLDYLESGEGRALKGVVFASAKGKIFIAGADLHGFTKNEPTPEFLGRLIDQGQQTYERIARLPMPTVAAIQGVCVGGGTELTLACDWRVAANDSATKIGLPEVQIGILPAWGGSVRLPRLIGLPAALPIILAGKQHAGVPAKKIGLVDEIAYPEGLLDTAERLLRRGKRPPAAKTPLANLPVARDVVAATARRGVLAKTRGNYPAALKALEVAVKALGVSHAEGLKLERSAFIELAGGDVARNLISIFFLQERAKKLKLPADLTLTGGDADAAVRPKPVRKSAVVGAGLMGAGIAQWLAGRGHRVLLKDISPDALAKGMQSIGKIFRDAAKRRVFTQADAQAGFDRVLPVVSNDVPMRDVDVVIEAAVERLDLKKKIFAGLEEQVGPETVLATNTSALSIDAIAEGLKRPERVVGIHFFNPVHRMQLVELVRGTKTSAAALDTALGLVKGIGKLPVITRDRPGFLVNRILLPYMVEAVRLFLEGHHAHRIDRLMLNFGMPMGPIRLTDEVGLDVADHVARDLAARLPHAAPAKDDVLQKLVGQGALGRKAGKGFYTYAAGGKEKKGGDDSLPPMNTAAALLQPGRGPQAGDDLLRDRMVLIMVNEAARVLEENVVDAPEDVDFGMIMGTGWAPFRGGPLRYADSRGLPEIVRRLEELAKTAGEHFRPAKLLQDLAREGKGFYSLSKPTSAAAAPGVVAPAPVEGAVPRSTKQEPEPLTAV